MTNSTKLKQAEKEGTATVYGVVEIPEMQPWVKAFEEKYPTLKINYVREYVYGVPSPMAKRIMDVKSKSEPTADAVIVAPYTAVEMKELGLLRPYFSDALEGYPGEFREPEGYWSPIMLLPTVQICNTSLSDKETPKSLQDLLNPKFKGKISMHDPTMGTATSYWLTALAPWVGKETWLRFIQGLATLQPKFFRLFPDVVKDVAERRSLIGLTVHLLDYLAAKEVGSPIKLLTIREIPMLTATVNICFVSSGPHPHVAELFADFLLSEEGQKTIGNTVGRIPALPDVDARFSLKNILPGAPIHLFPRKETIRALPKRLSAIREAFPK